MIPEKDRAILGVIQDAAESGDLALLEAMEKSSGEIHTLLVVRIQSGEDEINILPVARILGNNAVDLYAPPLGEGEFASTPEQLREAGLQVVDGAVPSPASFLKGDDE